MPAIRTQMDRNDPCACKEQPVIETGFQTSGAGNPPVPREANQPARTAPQSLISDYVSMRALEVECDGSNIFIAGRRGENAALLSIGQTKGAGGGITPLCETHQPTQHEDQAACHCSWQWHHNEEAPECLLMRWGIKIGGLSWLVVCLGHMGSFDANQSKDQWDKRSLLDRLGPNSDRISPGSLTALKTQVKSRAR